MSKQGSLTLSWWKAAPQVNVGEYEVTEEINSPVIISVNYKESYNCSVSRCCNSTKLNISFVPFDDTAIQVIPKNITLLEYNQALNSLGPVIDNRNLTLNSGSSLKASGSSQSSTKLLQFYYSKPLFRNKQELLLCVSLGDNRRYRKLE